MKQFLATIQTEQTGTKPTLSVSRQTWPRQAARLAMVGAAVLGWATAGHAQYIASLYSDSVAFGGAEVTNQGNNAVGPLVTNEVVGPTSSYSIANYGLLGGKDSGDSSATGLYTSVGATSTVYFTDVIPIVSLSNPVNAIIPYTVKMSLFGNYAITDDGGLGSSDSEVSLSVYTLNYNGTNTGVSGSYVVNNTDNGGSFFSQTEGSLSFSGSAQNNTMLYINCNMVVSAGGQNGGDGEADYANTAVFNIESSVADAQFVGSQGTNYETVSDIGGAASAPEPATFGLLLPALGLFAAGTSRRRRR